MERSIRLPLYGDIDHGPEDNLAWDLYQTEALARLRDISLSSLPTRFAPHGSAASRFAHSVGVGYLARLLVDDNPIIEKERLTLTAAALCHDIGSPPFSHISEVFMFDQLGKTHEEQTEMLLNGGGEIENLLNSYNVRGEDVLALVLGKGAYGPLIAGSIDLDNIDNSLHLLTSVGASAGRSYDPRRLIRAFIIDESSVSLNANYADQLISWDSVRRRLYDLLQREEQLSSSTMLYRSIEFAAEAEALPEDFWQWEEGRALAFLRYNSGDEAGRIVDNLNRWRQYHLAYSQTNEEEDRRLSGIYDNWPERFSLANSLAEQLSIPRDKLALYIGRDKGVKAITLPFVGPRAQEVAALFSGQEGSQRLGIYLAKNHLDKADKIEGALAELLSDLPEGKPGHSFF